ncbi:hypothetical protein AN958_01372 [Leucoagaricus sp. SymC.cos]|nr:hypothetical protein AN958_01372 [Leucoagaricus sp. SymC.cos]
MRHFRVSARSYPVASANIFLSSISPHSQMRCTSSSCCILVVPCRRREAHLPFSQSMGTICPERCPDGALREGSENNKLQLPTFASNRARASEDALKPFLVVLNAEIAFRRFRRRPHPLCAEYTELIDLTIDLTIDLVHKIYFKPLVNQIKWKLNQTRLAYSKDAEGDVNMGGTVDEFGTGKAVGNDKAITPRVIGKKSRTGTVVKRPVLSPPMTKL